MLPDFRKLLADVKQWKGRMELTFERLPETLSCIIESSKGE